MYFFEKKSVIAGCFLFLLVRSYFSVDLATGMAEQGGRLKGVTVDRTIFFRPRFTSLFCARARKPYDERQIQSPLATRNHKFSPSNKEPQV